MEWNKKPVLSLILTALATGCASMHAVEKTQGQGNEFYDGNVPPLSMQPPTDLSHDGQTVDPFYMNTQADYHFTLGESYSLEGQTDRAIEEFKLTLVYDPNSAQVRTRLATEYLRKGMVSESLEQAKIAVEKDSRFADARVLLGSLYATLKVYDEAEKQFQDLMKLYPEKYDYALQYGALLAEQKKYEASAVVFKSVGENKSNNEGHLAYYYLGRVYLEQKAYADAEKSFQKALTMKPDYDEAVIALGRLLEEKKQRTAVIKLFENYQDKHGPNVKIAEALGKFYLEDEEYKKAYHQYEFIENTDPSNLNIKVRMALILIEEKKLEHAAKKLKQILVQAPDSDKIRFYLGAIYEETQSSELAIEQFKKIPPTSGFYSESVAHMAYLYRQKSKLDMAIQVVEEGMENAPQEEIMYTLYGSLMHEKKDYAVALKKLKSIQSKFPNSDQIQFFIGSLSDKLGNKDETIASMTKVLEINPDHIQALNYLAYTYAEDGVELKKAEVLSKKAVSLKSEDPYIQDTLGWVLFKQGRYDEAIKTLQVAHGLKPEESIISEHLGDAYYRAEMPSKARIMYLKALQSEKDEGNAKKIHEKISSIDRTQKRIPASSR